MKKSDVKAALIKRENEVVSLVRSITVPKNNRKGTVVAGRYTMVENGAEKKQKTPAEPLILSVVDDDTGERTDYETGKKETSEKKRKKKERNNDNDTTVVHTTVSVDEITFPTQYVHMHRGKGVLVLGLDANKSYVPKQAENEEDLKHSVITFDGIEGSFVYCGESFTAFGVENIILQEVNHGQDIE